MSESEALSAESDGLGGWPVADHLLDPVKLASWMDVRDLGHGEPLTDARLLLGGTQNFLIRFCRGENVYVLRRPPEHKRKNSDETMRREARVLAALAGSDVPHPTFIAGESDETLMGATFYLMSEIEGFHAPDGLPAPVGSDESMQHRMGLAMAEAIAALGALDHRAVGLGDFGKPGYLERQVPRWRGQLESYAAFEGYGGVDLPAADELGDWLEAHRPTQWQPGIIHGDFHIANVLFQPQSGDLAAVVDWELATIGDPLIDLGQLRALWPSDDNPAQLHEVRPPGFATADELVDRYSDNTTRDLSNIDWYTALAAYRLGSILEGSNARADAGLAPREIGDQLHGSAVALFQRAATIANL